MSPLTKNMISDLSHVVKKWDKMIESVMLVFMNTHQAVLPSIHPNIPKHKNVYVGSIFR